MGVTGQGVKHTLLSVVDDVEERTLSRTNNVACATAISTNKVRVHIFDDECYWPKGISAPGHLHIRHKLASYRT
eukprot:2640139-Pyramimonas_sp.AAC.2